MNSCGAIGAKQCRDLAFEIEEALIEEKNIKIDEAMQELFISM